MFSFFSRSCHIILFRKSAFSQLFWNKRVEKNVHLQATVIFSVNVLKKISLFFTFEVVFSFFYLWGSFLLEDPSISSGFLSLTCSTVQNFICHCRFLSGIGLQFHPATPRKHFHHTFLSFSKQIHWENWEDPLLNFWCLLCLVPFWWVIHQVQKVGGRGGVDFIGTIYLRNWGYKMEGGLFLLGLFIWEIGDIMIRGGEGVDFVGKLTF